MEKVKNIIGFELTDVNKLPDNRFNLLFKDIKNNSYEISFNGYYFETKEKVKNQKVQYASIRDNLGFKAYNELMRHHENLDDYRQLFIMFDNSSDENKAEIICAVNNLEIKKHVYA